MAKEEPAYTRWIPKEWQVVAAAAIPLIDKGKTVVEALISAQRHLPKERRRDPGDMKKMSWQISTKKYIAEARTLSPEQRAVLAPPPVRKPQPPRKKMDEGREYGGTGGVVRWTTLEKARIARQVKQWQDAGVTRALSRMIIEAQEYVLEADRRRPVISIQAGSTAGHNDRLMTDGLANQWLLKEIEEQQQAEASESAPAHSESIKAPEALQGPEAPASPPPPPLPFARSQRLQRPLATRLWKRWTDCSKFTPTQCCAPSMTGSTS